MEENKIKILMVEDNPKDIHFMKYLLKDSICKFEIETASYLRKGIDKLNKNNFDVILLDLFLPDSSGLDTYTNIQDNASNLPVIILTGFSSEKLAVEAVKKGAQDYLVKGQIDSEKIEQAILYAIEREKLLNEMLSKEKNLSQSERLSSLSTMVVGMAHNLNNPLTGIKVALEIMKMQGELSGDQKETLKTMEKQTDRIKQIVKELTSMAPRKIKKNKEININEVCQKTMPQIKKLCNGNGKTIELKTSFSSVSPITGNDGEIKQGVINLLSNSVEAIDNRGIIELRTYEDDQNCTIEVNDTGKGMSEDIQEKIFDPFFSLKEGISAKGLGMSVVQRIVERHNGEIQVQSKEGQGTKILLNFPKVAC